MLHEHMSWQTQAIVSDRYSAYKVSVKSLFEGVKHIRSELQGPLCRLFSSPNQKSHKMYFLNPTVCIWHEIRYNNKCPKT